MKKYIKIISIIICIICTNPLNLYALGATTNIYEQIDDYYSENLKTIELASKIQNELFQYYNIKDQFKDQHPDYYGGLYISDDGKNLIIQIVKDNIPEKESKDYDFFNRIINYDESVKIEFVTNTFNNLNKTNNSIAEKLTANQKEININGNYLDVINNKVVVEIDDEEDYKKIETKEKIARINEKNSISTSIENIIEFKKTKKPSKEATLNPGGPLSIDNSCSIAFRTKLNGREGIVTAGHCLEGLKYCSIGEVISIQYSNNNAYDYAFVATTSSYSLSNLIAYPGDNVTRLAVVDYCPIITTNMAIAKSGITTKYTKGKVTGLNQTVKYSDDNYTIHGLVKSNLKSDKGDSGGIVFIPRPDNEGSGIAVGIVSGGGNGILGIGRTMYFTDINSLPSELQYRY